MFRLGLAFMAAIRPIYTLSWEQPATSDLEDPSNPSTYYWDLEDLVAGDYPETKIGGGTHDLSPFGGTSAHLTERVAPGIYSGNPADGLTGRKCLECAQGAAPDHRWVAGGTDVLDSSQGNIAIRFRFRMPGNFPSNDLLLGTRGTGASGDGGWYIFRSSSGFRFSLHDDGGGTASTVYSSEAPWDNAWHDAEFIVDWDAGATGEIRSRLDGVSKTVAIPAGLTKAGSKGAPFSIGGTFGFNCALAQIERVRGWEEADGATSIDSQTWSDVSNLHVDPHLGTAFEEDTTSYTGTLAVPCDLGTETGLWYAASGDEGHVPIGYSSKMAALGAPDGFLWWGVQANFVNLITYSEQYEHSSWTKSGAGVSTTQSLMLDNKLGFNQARYIVANNNNDYIAHPITLATSTVHNLCCWIAGAATYGSASGRLMLWDVTAGAEIAGTDFTVADSVWEPVHLETTTHGTNTSYEFRVRINTQFDRINMCHALLAASTVSRWFDFGLIVTTYGASVAQDNVDGKIVDFTAELDYPESKGSLEFWYISATDAVQGNGAYGFSIQPTSGGLGQTIVKFGSGGQLTVNLEDDAGANQFSEAYIPPAFTDAIRALLVWDSADEVTPGFYAQCRLINGAYDVTKSEPASGWGATHVCKDISLASGVGSNRPTFGLGPMKFYDKIINIAG